MGYRSDVAYAIVFERPEDRETILGRLTPEQRKTVEAEAVLGWPDRIVFHEESVKWYSTRLVLINGYEDVDAHEELLAVAEAAYDNGEMKCMGIFMRVGEEDDDLERNYWGEEVNGVESWYDLVSLSRHLVIGWEA